jgi:hypothetical protein
VSFVSHGSHRNIFPLLDYLQSKTYVEQLTSFSLLLLFFRQRMQEENLIHRSYSAYLNDVNSPCSLFHNCFYSSETIDWLIKQQLCKTIYDGLEIFQVLEKLKIIHHGKWSLA